MTVTNAAGPWVRAQPQSTDTQNRVVIGERGQASSNQGSMATQPGSAPTTSPSVSFDEKGKVILRTSATAEEMEAQRSQTKGSDGIPTDGATAPSVSTKAGSGTATRPSIGDRTLAWMADKWDSFKNGFTQLKDYFGDSVSHFRGSEQNVTNSPPIHSNKTDMTSHLRTEICRSYYNFILESANDFSRKLASGASGDQINTFLRTDGTAGSIINKEAANFTRDLQDKLVNMRPNSSEMKLFVPLPELVPVDSTNPNSPKELVPYDPKSGKLDVPATNGVQLALDICEELYGKDDASSQAASAKVPQNIKDTIATGLKAINASEGGVEAKAIMQKTFLANIRLRVFAPALAIQGAAPGYGILKEVSKILTSISNRAPITSQGKEQLLPIVEEKFLALEKHLVDNMDRMLMYAGAQGVVSPSATENTV